MHSAFRTVFLLLLIAQFTAALRAFYPLLHPQSISLRRFASTINCHQNFVAFKIVNTIPSLSLRCKPEDPTTFPEDPFVDVDESVLRLQTERDKVYKCIE